MNSLLKIKLNNPDLISLYRNHSHAYHDDSGIDLFIAETTIIPPGALGHKISLGISLEMIMNSKNTSYFIMSRSSMCKSKLRLTNAIYLIDSGFRGNLFIFVDNFTAEPVKVNFGDSYVQICNHNLSRINCIVVDNLSAGTRNEKGLGSSGISKL